MALATKGKLFNLTELSHRLNTPKSEIQSLAERELELDLMRRIARAQRLAYAKSGKTLNSAELAQRLSEPKKTIEQVLRNRSAPRISSLEDVDAVSEDRGLVLAVEDVGLKLKERLSDEASSVPASRKYELRAARETIERDLLMHLGEIEREVVRTYYGFTGDLDGAYPRPYRDVVANLKISGKIASQLVQRALAGVPPRQREQWRGSSEFDRKMERRILAGLRPRTQKLIARRFGLQGRTPMPVIEICRRFRFSANPRTNGAIISYRIASAVKSLDPEEKRWLLSQLPPGSVRFAVRPDG